MISTNDPQLIDSVCREAGRQADFFSTARGYAPDRAVWWKGIEEAARCARRNQAWLIISVSQDQPVEDLPSISREEFADLPA